MFSRPGTLHATLCCWFLLMMTIRLEAQRIVLGNPSMEGEPGKGIIPSPWFIAGGTPDTQPGIFDVKQQPSAGRSYIGMHSGKGFLEGTGQALQQPLKPHTTYVLSFDLAFTAYYLYPACYGNLAIYGGNAPGDTAALLWTSGNFTHTDWKRYHAVFRAMQAWRYISFWAYPATPCNKSSFGIALLIDNLSAIDELIPPVVTATVKPCSCGEVTDGSITLHVTGGAPPFQFQLDNGMWQTDSVFNGLVAGPHNGKIKDSHEFSATVDTVVASPWKNCLVVFPNAFSPNNDGQNDIFRPKVYDAIHDYRLQVYDRWGKLVFSSQAPGSGWDGNVRGVRADVQSYVYICTYTDSRQEQHMLKGSVFLLY
ncbi:gliding motility-associated C-terminal domain-containing protein [Chitinophaga terrae (ex Kim and Jung 2007)]|uniref:Gliding motility-associated C-terminal domain-containing protein n=1 Tax=Chitinophaga terrae (ex Kim and Jung 2007) TaxID=408074 RepID=A0A1H4BQF1_9BACT|nr:gliding motility-associated C-terminal domain-containing protein [Chitinophaga terrae (ex Kim and Jung 2007)]SEA50052.1 gliding motility-associated C-terminal domain-containing protein [Chitinophaga terrae (ex Kim and Jung 2007)]